MATTLYLEPGSSPFFSIIDLTICRCRETVRILLKSTQTLQILAIISLRYCWLITLNNPWTDRKKEEDREGSFIKHENNYKNHDQLRSVTRELQHFTFSQLSLEQYLGSKPIIRRSILARGPLSWICSWPRSSSVVRAASVSAMLHTIPVARPSSFNDPDDWTGSLSWRMLTNTSTCDTTKCKTCRKINRLILHQIWTQIQLLSRLPVIEANNGKKYFLQAAVTLTQTTSV